MPNIKNDEQQSVSESDFSMSQPHSRIRSRQNRRSRLKDNNLMSSTTSNKLMDASIETMTL